MQSPEPPVYVAASTDIQYQNDKTIRFQAVDDSQIANTITV